MQRHRECWRRHVRARLTQSFFAGESVCKQSVSAHENAIARAASNKRKRSSTNDGPSRGARVVNGKHVECVSSSIGLIPIHDERSSAARTVLFCTAARGAVVGSRQAAVLLWSTASEEAESARRP